MKVLNLIWEYRFILLTILSIILYALTEWNSFKSKAYTLMLLAKSLAKDAILKSGDEQVEWVLKAAYQLLPKRYTVFLPEDRMRKVIFYLYHKGKDYLDDGKFNGSTS